MFFPSKRNNKGLFVVSANEKDSPGFGFGRVGLDRSERRRLENGTPVLYHWGRSEASKPVVSQVCKAL